MAKSENVLSDARLLEFYLLQACRRVWATICKASDHFTESRFIKWCARYYLIVLPICILLLVACSFGLGYWAAEYEIQQQEKEVRHG